MVVTVFRARVRADITPDKLKRLLEYNARMGELAPRMPGFISYKDFAAQDGENVTVVEFDTHEHQAAWRAHPAHVEAQKFGRDEAFSTYQIQVCDVLRVTSFPTRA